MAPVQISERYHIKHRKLFRNRIQCCCSTILFYNLKQKISIKSAFPELSPNKALAFLAKYIIVWCGVWCGVWCVWCMANSVVQSLSMWWWWHDSPTPAQSVVSGVITGSGWHCPVVGPVNSQAERMFILFTSRHQRWKLFVQDRIFDGTSWGGEGWEISSWY